MTTYVVLIPGDERAWAAATPEQRAATYDRHARFAALLAERGHTVNGGAELAPSWTATSLRLGRDGTVTVTDGPYAEAAEQVTGYYEVESDDLADLTKCCRLLVDGTGGIEIRAVAPDGGADA